MTEQDVHEYRIGRRGWLHYPSSLLRLEDSSPPWISWLCIPLVLRHASKQVSCSYLRISPAGLKLFYWPNYQLELGWDQVDRIAPRKVLFSTRHLLYLKEKASFGSRTMRGQVLGWGPQRFICLSDFEGWPEGGLAEDLERYAPQLFAAELEKESR